MACCCGACPGVCSGIDERGYPNYLQIEVSNFSGSLGDFARSPNGTYSIPTIQISCSIFPQGQASCVSVQNECGLYRIFLDLNAAPRFFPSTPCCGGRAQETYFHPDRNVDAEFTVRNTGFSFGYADSLPCCSYAMGCSGGAAFTYTQAQWLTMLCNRTLDLSGTATGAYRYTSFPSNVFFGSVSFDYRITVNDLP